MEGQKALLITEVFYPEEFLINDIVLEWTQKGHEIDVLTRNPSYPYGEVFDGYRNKLFQKEKFRDTNANIFRYHIIQGYRDSTFRKISNYIYNAVLSSIIALLKFRKHKKIFVYHTGPLTVALPAILLKKINGAHVTIWTQDLWPDTIFAFGIRKNKLKEKLINRMVRFIYSNCDSIIVSSPAFKDKISQFSKAEIRFIPNWPGKNFESIEPVAKSPRFTFTFAGNIGKMQNLDRLILAFWNWSKNDEKVQFDIYGNGSEFENLNDIIQKNDIRNVKLHGRIPQAQVPAVYSHSDVLVISLKSDAVFDLYIPAKFSTYLTAKKPIFAVMAGQVAELTQKYGVGKVSASDDLSEMEQGFDFFTRLSEKEKRDMGDRAWCLYDELFNREVSIEKLEKLVFEIE